MTPNRKRLQEVLNHHLRHSCHSTCGYDEDLFRIFRTFSADGIYIGLYLCTPSAIRLVFEQLDGGNWVLRPPATRGLGRLELIGDPCEELVRVDTAGIANECRGIGTVPAKYNPHSFFSEK